MNAFSTRALMAHLGCRIAAITRITVATIPDQLPHNPLGLAVHLSGVAANQWAGDSGLFGC